jgi:DNA-directed RNA polymerase subunit RPC12/RpoP
MVSMSADTAVNAITNLEWGHIRQRFGGSGRRHKMTNEPTRERLERALGVLKLHHKMLVNEIDGMTHDINESIDAFAVGIANEIDGMTHDILANAELERQSVTDEDVAEAIEWLDEDRRNLERKVAHTSSFNAGILRRELNRVRLAIQALQAYQKPTGETSDGYHTFYELYEHRTALFAALCNTYNDRSWKSFKHADGTMYDGMFIAGIETPEGQYTYHCEEEYLYMFAMTKEMPNAPEWDGHKPSDYSRLFALNLKEGYRPERELYKIAKHPNPDDLTETAIAQLTYDIERINTLRGDEWDYEPGAEEMRKELSAKYGHAINALMDYNKTVTVTWIGDPDDCPSAICSRCDHDLTIYDWYDKLVFGPRNYCPYCGGRIVKQITEEYTGEDEWEEEV